MAIFLTTMMIAAQLASASPTRDAAEESRWLLRTFSEAYAAKRLDNQSRLNAVIERAPAGSCRNLAIAARGLALGADDAEFLMDESHLVSLQARMTEVLPDGDAGEEVARLLLLMTDLADARDKRQAELVATMRRQAAAAEAQVGICTNY